MMDYSLCKETVTVYRKVGDRIQRSYYHKCYLQCKIVMVRDELGTFKKWEFMLIVPGDRPLMVGDRVVSGIGKDVSYWYELGNAMQVSYAKPYYLDGKICHWEAGSK
ncbi:MAG: hypothetical protein E7461_04365 [Ruminococcaceae bacterium]|nr:hypothetical protein [Oscillospiraceae bacterium]